MRNDEAVETAALIKGKFRKWDEDGQGLISSEKLQRILSRLGLSELLSQQLVEGLACSSPEELVAYDTFVDSIFASCGPAVQPLPLGNVPLVASGDAAKACAKAGDNGGDQVQQLPWSEPCYNGLRSLLRSTLTLRLGRLRHAASPTLALEDFLRTDSEVVQPSPRAQEQMRSLMRAALPKLTMTDDLQHYSEIEDFLETHRALFAGSYFPEEVAGDFEGSWKRFARWCTEQLLREVFELANLSGSANMSAEELMVLLMLIATQRPEAPSTVATALDREDAEQIVREFDNAGDGHLNELEFLEMAHALEREADVKNCWSIREEGCEASMAPGAGKQYRPHLMLYFDVNNTVLISDSLTGADATKLISMTLAGSAWGIEHSRGAGGQATWVLVDPVPRPKPLWEGLTSYAKFVTQAYPMPTSGNPDELEKTKQHRRDALQQFCEAGHPGERLRPHLDRLLGALSKECRLLPSFLFMLRELKRAKRSFSVAFRTFGVDLDESIQEEFNAFCEGRHPILPAEGPVLDGSDGAEDHRMSLDDPNSIGTFFRSPEDNKICLIWGTHAQPPRGANLDFYDQVPGTKVVEGAPDVASSLWRRMQASGRTVVLRDYYPGWAKQKFFSTGGKPIFVQVEDEAVFPLFFDDHVQPENPTIVDVIDVRDYPRRVLMPQVYGIHCVKATPLRSISELSYFWDELIRCEAAKAAQLKRRRAVAQMLHDPEALRAVIVMLGGEEHQEKVQPQTSQEKSIVGEVASHMAHHYTSWHDSEAVKYCSPLPPDATEEPIVTRRSASFIVPSGQDAGPQIEKIRRRSLPGGQQMKKLDLEQLQNLAS